MRTQVDLNCDMGEWTDPTGLANDRALLRLITSANIACGGHAGNEVTMRATVDAALEAGVAIGAHPGLRDPQGLGRRNADCSPSDAYDVVAEQVRTLSEVVRTASGRVAHVKPHGALYNTAAVDAAVAEAVARAVADIDTALILFGLAGSELVRAGERAGLRVANEGFADRRYTPHGTLVARNLPDAVIADEAEAAEQAVALVQAGKIIAVDGTILDVHVDTICIHSDTPGAVRFAQLVRSRLEKSGIGVSAPRQSRSRP
jgi:UPF0271 protein